MSDQSDIGWVHELRQLAASAARGPWFVGYADDECFMSASYVSVQSAPDYGWPPEVSVVAITCLQMPSYAGNDLSEENTQFIAAARTGVPRLCDALISALNERGSLARTLRTVLDLADSAGLDPKFEVEIGRARRLLDSLQHG